MKTLAKLIGAIPLLDTFLGVRLCQLGEWVSYRKYRKDAIGNEY